MANEQVATDEEIATVKAALVGITPLPWTADRYNLFLRAGKKRMVADDGDGAEGVAVRIRGAGGGEPQEKNLHAIAAVMNAAPGLLDRIEADARRIAELKRVTGPPMPCGCYAVEMDYRGRDHVYCWKHKEMHHVPAYMTWKESR